MKNDKESGKKDPEYRIEAKSKTEKILLLKVSTFSILLLITDQITKQLIVEKFIQPHTDSLTVIPGFFNIVYVLNSGAAWGVFKDYGGILLAVALIALILIVFFFRHLTEGWPERFYSLALVSAGIMGNSCDRIIRSHGCVIDFLDFHYYDLYHWPAFNVADSSISIGVIIFFISIIFRPETGKSEKES